MRQTKRLTRRQWEYLEKHHIDTKGVRCVRETPEYLEYLRPDGEVKKIYYGGKK
jgi:hypothetical protein